MLGPGTQAAEAQPVQQRVDALQAAEVGVELVGQDALGVAAAEGADAVCFGGAVKDPLLEGFLLPGIKQRGSSGFGLGPDRLEPMVAVGVAPLLDELFAASGGFLDVGAGPSVQREAKHAESVALIRVAGGGDGGVELWAVLGAVKGDVQGDGSGGVRSIVDNERRRNRTGA